MIIYDMATVSHTDRQVFNEQLNHEVTQYQDAGLNVEVQYGPVNMGDYSVIHNALVIVRKKS
jgi:hypothetical protein